MSARDELAAVIVEAYGEDPSECPCEQDFDVAAHILAAGYSKPRTIETVEELDALPVETVVRSDMGNIYVKDYDMDDPSAIWWVTAGAVSEFQSNRILLPATILYEPEAAA